MTDGPNTSIDFNNIGAIRDYAYQLMNEIQHELVDTFLRTDKWEPLEHPRGQGNSLFGTLDEGRVVLSTAQKSRATVTQGADDLVKALDHTCRTLTTMMDNFHSVEELNRADQDGKGQLLPNFTAPTGQAGPGY